MHGEILVRVRLRLLRRAAVHDDAHELLPRRLFLAKDLDRVAVALAHLLAVRARHQRDVFTDARLRHHERLAVGLVELDRDVARDFEVLLLVLAHRHDVRVEEQDVRGHQHRIGEQAVIDRAFVAIRQLRDLVLVAVTTPQQAHWRDRRKHPRELGDFSHVGLPPKNAAGGIEAAREEIQRDIERELPALRGVRERRHRVVVRDEIERLALLLELDGGQHRPEVVAQMQRARGLDAGQNSHGARAYGGQGPLQVRGVFRSESRMVGQGSCRAPIFGD